MPRHHPCARCPPRTAALNTLVGMTDLIATNPDDYVRIAVKVANDKPYAAELRRKLAERLPALYESKEAVQAWTNLLLRIGWPKKQQPTSVPK